MYNTGIIEAIRQHMIEAQQTLSVAESVTSGHIQAALSLASEATRFFQGGITTYNLGQKARHLHVNPIHAASCNSVSQDIADEMAKNAIRLFSSDWAIAVTGYASPLPEMGITDPFAFYTMAHHEVIVCRGRVLGKGDGALDVQLYYTNHILGKVSEYLDGHRVHSPKRDSAQ